VEKIGATITLLVRELRAQQIALTPLQATLFLIGLYEDTFITVGATDKNIAV
jgi:nanoRNase/pAp phosphatase (c-di-AMP/oligoRNAs hydrolase)